MASFNLTTAGVSLLAKSFSAFCCTNSLARCSSVLPVSYLMTSRALNAMAGGPPKRPLNGYLRFVMKQKPFVIQQHPDIKLTDVIRKIAQQWRLMSEEQKRPFEEDFERARDQFKRDLQAYQAQLSPAEVEQQATEKKKLMAKRKLSRKKKELSGLGKPKRPRSPFNIFMSENMESAQGLTMPAKLISLMEDWRNLLSYKKQVYMQLAEDDKIRYKNEIKSWERNMLELGREDLVREQSRPKKEPPVTTGATRGSAKAGAGKAAGKAKGAGKPTQKATPTAARSTKSKQE